MTEATVSGTSMGGGGGGGAAAAVRRIVDAVCKYKEVRSVFDDVRDGLGEGVVEPHAGPVSNKATKPSNASSWRTTRNPAL